MCLDNLPMSDGYQLSCGHRFCKECLEEFVQGTVGSGETHLQCVTLMLAVVCSWRQ